MNTNAIRRSARNSHRGLRGASDGNESVTTSVKSDTKSTRLR